LKLEPNAAAGTYCLLGIAYSEQGDYDKAIESYQKAIERKPKWAEAYYLLGIVYFIQDDYDKTIESYQKAIERKPKWAEAYYSLGITYKNQGDYAEAIEAYHNAVKFKPNFAEAYRNLGSAYKNQNKYATAIKFYRKAIELEIDYDDYFSSRLDKYTITEKHEKYKTYTKIYLSSKIIMWLLHVDNIEETEWGFAHYTRKITAEELLIKEKKGVSPIEKAKEEESVSPFRLSSILTSNDPEEGTIAFKYFSLKNEEKDRDYQAFIACFTFDPECLNQFRLYGKDQGKEATGVSLVFRKDFFAKEPVGMISYAMVDTKEKSVTKQDTKQDEKEEYALFRCVYIDPETKQIMALGHKDDYTFFRDNDDKRKKELPDEGKKELSDKEKNEIDEKINNYKKKINKNLQAVREKFDELKQLIQDNKNEVEEKLVCDMLINLRYLVKHIAFKEEQECRVVKVESLRNHDKVTLNGDSMYIDTKTIDKLVDKIYFAPSATDMELFQEKLVYNDLKIECRQCKHPIRIAKT
jgi:tetratricopeptide (TPR) repeat protein